MCERVEPHPLGEVFLHPPLSRAWALNHLVVDEPDAQADAVLAAAGEVLAGLPHRRVVVEPPETGARLAPAFRERRWIVDRGVVMVLRGERDRDPAPGLAREVDLGTQLRVEEATIAEEPWGRDPEVLRELVELRRAVREAAPAVRCFVGAVDGTDACVATLYSDGRVAQVEEVGTLAAFRGRGLARATVSAAVDAAVRSRHELVFLYADDEDWPKELYARLGFVAVGRPWSFMWPGAEPPRDVVARG